MNFSFNCAHDMIDLGGSLAYHLAAAFSSVVMKDLARVVLSPSNDVITASHDIKNFLGLDFP
jgi:hypothetical protein